MFIDKDSIQIKINGMNDYLSIGQYIVSAEYNYPKLWGKDTGRNLAGETSGTLIGIFPKIILEFRKLNKSDLELLAPILDSKYQDFKYYDPIKKNYITIKTYTGDWKVTNKRIIGSNGKNEGFSISFIACKKRG